MRRARRTGIVALAAIGLVACNIIAGFESDYVVGGSSGTASEAGTDGPSSDGPTDPDAKTDASTDAPVEAQAPFRCTGSDAAYRVFCDDFEETTGAPFKFEKFDATTDARITSSRIEAGGLTVHADSANDLHMIGGAVTLGGAAVSGTFTVGLSDNATTASINGTTLRRSDIDVSGAVEVDAASRTGIKDYAIGGALAGGLGVAGAAAVNIVTNTTEATVAYADVGTDADRAGSLAVRAADTSEIRSVAGGLGAGGLAGVGAGASVNIFKNRVVASVDHAAVYVSGAVSVAAANTKKVDNVAAMAGLGGTVGIGGAVAVTLVGDSVQGEAASELDSGGSGTLTKVDDNAKTDRFASISTSDSRILSADDRGKLQGAANGAMPAWRQLSDTELAAVITFTKNNWGNKTGQLVQPSEVASARK